MSSAWGISWGESWGVSWGAYLPPPLVGRRKVRHLGLGLGFTYVPLPVSAGA